MYSRYEGLFIRFFDSTNNIKNRNIFTCEIPSIRVDVFSIISKQEFFFTSNNLSGLEVSSIERFEIKVLIEFSVQETKFSKFYLFIY